MMPDFGNEMWRRSSLARRSNKTVLYCLHNIRWGILNDRGSWREITGIVDIDNAGTYCLTLRTQQTQAELLKAVRDLEGIAVGELAPTQEVSATGEQFRALIGTLIANSDEVPAA